MATKKAAAKTVSGFEIGGAVFIRAVTNYFTGRVVAVADGAVVLDEAAWLADTGRFADYLQTGTANEVEPYPDGVRVRVMLGSIVDWCDWKHALPRTQE